MSSAISLAGQKWKELWGTSITRNEQMELKKRQINEADPLIRMAGRAIQGIAYQHQQMQVLLNLLSQVLKKLDELDKSQQGEKLVATFSALAQLHQMKMSKIIEATDNFKEWFCTIDQLKGMLDKNQENRLVYDHYRIKVDDLKKISDQKGSKILEKLSRNQNKFQKSSSTYQQACQEIINRMDHVIINKRNMINSAVQTVIYHEAETSYKTYKQLIKHEDFKSKFGGAQKQQVDSIQVEQVKLPENILNSNQKIIENIGECHSQENLSIKDIPAQGQDWNPFEQNNKSPYQDEEQFAQSQLVSSYFSQGVAPEGVNPFNGGEYTSFPSIYLPDVKMQSTLKQNQTIDYEKFKQSVKQPFE